MTRDEIIEDIRAQDFKTRYDFSKYLDDLCRMDGFKLAWPSAVLELPVAAWIEAHTYAIHGRDIRRLTVSANACTRSVDGGK